jgi:hypothetical protein
MTNGGRGNLPPSDVYPRLMNLIRQRNQMIDLFEEQASATGRAEARYDAAREAIKLKKRIMDGVKTTAEAETWAAVDPEVTSLNEERRISAGLQKATLLRIENLGSEIQAVQSMLVKERETDLLHMRHGEG